MSTPPSSPDELTIEVMGRHHVVREFQCGEHKLDDFLKRNAFKNTHHGFGRTYVAVKPGCTRVWAFFTLSASHVEASAMPSQSSPHYVSVVRLGRLGVENSIQRIGVGRKLMIAAFQHTLEAARHIGIHAIILDAKNEGLKTFYAKFGFMPVIGEPLSMYLPLDWVAQADRAAIEGD